ncbi:MAG: hypothetical protein M1833_001821 [Piccolia ochrophora]|nr:MAG: hypothetical protein M1833_001821 [Piccolia ochrophora]
MADHRPTTARASSSSSPSPPRPDDIPSPHRQPSPSPHRASSLPSRSPSPSSSTAPPTLPAEPLLRPSPSPAQQPPADPPLPEEQPPDDGWQPIWDPSASAYYFYNAYTHATTWTNPRVPDAPSAPATDETFPSAPLAPGLTAAPPPTLAGLGPHDRDTPDPAPHRETYNPSIHGSYDPTASYARPASPLTPPPAGTIPTIPTTIPTTAAAAIPLLDASGNPAPATAAAYAASATFNRFTGAYQTASLTPQNYNDDAKSHRQMAAFFDVDAAANAHEGRSLKKERQGQKLSRKEVKQFREKRKERREERRRAWLRD